MRELVAGTDYEITKLEFRVDLPHGRCKNRLRSESGIRRRKLNGRPGLRSARNVLNPVHVQIQLPNGAANRLAVFLLHKIFGDLVRDHHADDARIEIFKGCTNNPVFICLRTDLRS